MTGVEALPHRRVERWRWSDLRAAIGSELPPLAPAPASAPAANNTFVGLAAAEIVFVDGRVAIWPEEIVAGAPAVFAKANAEAGSRRNVKDLPLATLAVSDAADDWFPIIESRPWGGAALVRHVGGAERYSRHARVGVSVRAGEQLTLIESFEGPAAGFSNVLTECFVEPGGELTRIVLQPAATGAIVSTAEVFVGDGSGYRQFALAEGSRLARIESAVWARKHAQVAINGLYIAGKGRHTDLTSQVTLEGEGCTVRQTVNGVALKGGRGVFQGRFEVGRTAQKTDAQMQHHALLLEEGAEVFAKPELEIYADDVQCAHGNTAGQIDEAALFYIRSRGLPEAEARAMITRAFLMEAVPDWLDGPARAIAEARIEAWLP